MTDKEMEVLLSDVSFVVHSLTRKAYAKIDEYLKEFGLVRTHASILRLLKIQPVLSMSELGEKLQVTKQNITQLIDKLEKLGYVERSSAPTDRRVILIKLSDSGNTFVDTYLIKLHDYFSTIFSQLTLDDLVLFKSSIKVLKELLPKLKEE
jgi:DNA-binding MarR family transcriptional regulator